MSGLDLPTGAHQLDSVFSGLVPGRMQLATLPTVQVPLFVTASSRVEGPGPARSAARAQRRCPPTLARGPTGIPPESGCVVIAAASCGAAASPVAPASGCPPDGQRRCYHPARYSLAALLAEERRLIDAYAASPVPITSVGSLRDFSGLQVGVEPSTPASVRGTTRSSVPVVIVEQTPAIPISGP
jgi:hypothetical protein